VVDLKGAEDVCDDPDEAEGLLSVDGLVEIALFPDDVSELVSGQLQSVAVGEGLPISPLFDCFDLDFIGSVLFDPLFLSTPISRGFPLLGRSKL
jgi:hypothetical protein